MLSILYTVFHYPATTFGEKLRKKRLEMSLRQVDLAKLLGANETSIVKWEKDRNPPSRGYREKIKKSLGQERCNPALLREGGHRASGGLRGKFGFLKNVACLSLSADSCVDLLTMLLLQVYLEYLDGLAIYDNLHSSPVKK
jgi:DNA-binding XRE family transcriptional regulator